MKATRLLPLMTITAVLCHQVWLGGEDKKASISLTRPFDDWFAACQDLPSNRRQPLRWPGRELLPFKEFSEFEAIIDAYLAQSQEGPLAQPEQWLGETLPGAPFFNINELPEAVRAFEPFAQRLDVPAGSEVILHGDLHGDIRSLVRSLKALNERGYLDGFRITKPNTYLVFLGDYTDRGLYGVEVIYTILRLKLANPDHVHMVRGNHEELSMVLKYGFVEEGVYKFGKAFKHKKVARIYDFLPAVLYLGSEGNYVQCNHGGMEPGYSARMLLEAKTPVAYEMLGELTRADFLKEHPNFRATLPQNDDTTIFLDLLYQNFRLNNPRDPELLGFLWGDFALQAHEPPLRWDDQRPGWMHGKEGTRMLLDRNGSARAKVQAVFRAHQHSRLLDPMMRRLIAGRGVFEHWQDADERRLTNADIPTLRERLDNRTEKRPLTPGAVYTLNVSPDSVYGLQCGYDFDTLTILKTAKKFADWRMQIINVDSFANR